MFVSTLLDLQTRGMCGRCAQSFEQVSTSQVADMGVVQNGKNDTWTKQQHLCGENEQPVYAPRQYPEEVCLKRSLLTLDAHCASLLNIWTSVQKHLTLPRLLKTSCFFTPLNKQPPYLQVGRVGENQNLLTFLSSQNRAR